MPFKISKYFLLTVVLLALAFVLGCGQEEPPAESKPLFLMDWGIGAGQLKNAEDGRPVAEETDSLMYRKTLNGYSFYITYEFENNELLRIYLNVNSGNNDDEQNVAMLDYLEDIVTNRLGPLRYVQTDDMLMLGETALCEMRQTSAWNGLKAKIIFYDVNNSENAGAVENFERYWQDERWPKGRVD